MNPYADLPDAAFWRPAVADADPVVMTGLHCPKFPLDTGAAIATAGSCFAQHVARALKGAGLTLPDAEPAPRGVPDDLAQRFGFTTYSARYGNIYTARQMAELLADAAAGMVHPDLVWPLGDRFVDALRPSVEPDGLDSAELVLAHRRAHLNRLAQMLPQVTHLVFTLGLTEAWQDVASGRTLPTCPGTVAGAFDAKQHRFVNFTVSQVLDDLSAIRQRLHGFAPGAKMLLTVSPVPLTATASGGHVLPATMRSKAVLRAAAGEFADAHDDVDYFPAYEIITNPAARGRFYDDSLRSVTPEGVTAVMAAFAASYALPKVAASAPARDVICEEILLEAMR